MLSNDRRRLGFELKKGKQMGGGGGGGTGGGIGKGCELPSVKVHSKPKNLYSYYIY